MIERFLYSHAATNTSRQQHNNDSFSLTLCDFTIHTCTRSRSFVVSHVCVDRTHAQGVGTSWCERYAVGEEWAVVFRRHVACCRSGHAICRIGQTETHSRTSVCRFRLWCAFHVDAARSPWSALLLQSSSKALVLTPPPYDPWSTQHTRVHAHCVPTSLQVQSLDLLEEVHNKHDVNLKLPGSIRLVERGNADRLAEAQQHVAMAKLFDRPGLVTEMIQRDQIQDLCVDIVRHRIPRTTMHSVVSFGIGILSLRLPLPRTLHRCICAIVLYLHADATHCHASHVSIRQCHSVRTVHVH